MYNSSGLIPARFLILISHFIISVTLLWNKEETARACSSEEISLSDPILDNYHIQWAIGLSLMISFLIFELLAFVFGFTMFNSNSALLYNKEGGNPTQLFDLGTENVVVEKMQIALREHYGRPILDGLPPFVYGSSPANQQIECWWAILRMHHSQFWLNHFHELKGAGLFSGSFLDKSLIQFCFLNITTIGGHALACVFLTGLALHGWQCGWFWWIFSFGSALPFMYDTMQILDVMIHGKY